VNPDEVRRQWAERSGEYSPDYYAHYGPDESSERVRERLDRAGGPDASVLELGCSSGRHLAHLHAHGYRDLHGIEINESAFDVMERAYPELAETGSFHADAIQAWVNARTTATTDADVLALDLDADGDGDAVTVYLVADVNGSDYANASLVEATDRTPDHECTLEEEAAANADEELATFRERFVDESRDVSVAYQDRLAAQYAGQVACSFDLAR
jgi:SAM-dependent methyltransferase